MNKKYAMLITRRHRTLVALINGGVEPAESMMTGKHWLLFEIEEDGKDSINHDIVPERTLFQTHDIAGSFPIIVRLKN